MLTMLRHPSIILTLSFLLWAPISAAKSLPKKILDTVYASTFEVVVKKVGEGALEYEKPLPMDRIPFHIRNDKYWSIGTAFAIGKNTFVTAAHVFMLSRDSQYEGYYLRDTKGKVYEVGTVSKYSGKKDFIVFSLKSHKVKKFLKLNKKLDLNEAVYSVGNALGEGVVIRDGLYTSNTPEQESGEWNWMRFSAAASPGNSGGPLLDSKGQVVGIVLRKSENENLNYALPIKLVSAAPKNLATDNALFRYGIDNMDYSYTERFTFKDKLPLSFAELSKRLIKANNEFTLSLSKKMLAENAKDIFPNGEGSRDLLHRTYAAEFPHLVWQKGDRTWAPYLPTDIRKSDLGSNGYLKIGNLRSTVMMQIRKPDDLQSSTFLKDGKTLLDLVLKAIPFTRNVGGESIRILSMGGPRVDEIYQDRYKRKWFYRVWDIPYDDSSIVMMSLPTPNGNVSMLRRSATSQILAHADDMKVLSDFLYLSYYGSLSEWDQFLARKDLLPEAFNTVVLKYKAGQVVEFKSDSVSFSYDAELMNITDKSDIFLNMSYLKQGDKVDWGITRVAVGEEINSGRYFDVTMNIKPSDQMNDSDKSRWKKLANEEFPYNGESFFKNRSTSISALYARKVPSDERVNQPALFSVSYSIDGKIEQQAAEEKLQSFMKRLTISDR
ncbi:MAG: serine protease [Gammaproteobacteria bacterium]|nr:serine protease [Gammaproteobacteria bacterium]MDH5802464.1 serine protease [Gammaproteobacteria bacterium]